MKSIERITKPRREAVTLGHSLTQTLRGFFVRLKRAVVSLVGTDTGHGQFLNPLPPLKQAGVGDITKTSA